MISVTAIMIFSVPYPKTEKYHPKQINNTIMVSNDYSNYSVDAPKTKDTMKYNSMSMEELIEENNNIIIQQIYKNLTD